MSLERLTDRPSDLQQKINAEAQLAKIEHEGRGHVDSIANLIDDKLAEGVHQEHQKHQDQKPSFQRRFSLIARRRNAGNVSRLRPR